MVKKIGEKSLKCYGHVQQREEGQMLRSMSDAAISGQRRREETENQMERLCNRDMESLGLKVEIITDRTKWMTEI